MAPVAALMSMARSREVSAPAFLPASARRKGAVHRHGVAPPPLAELPPPTAQLHVTLALAAATTSVAAFLTSCGVAYMSDLVTPFSPAKDVALANRHTACWAPQIARAIG